MIAPRDLLQAMAAGGTSDHPIGPPVLCQFHIGHPPPALPQLLFLTGFALVPLHIACSTPLVLTQRAHHCWVVVICIGTCRFIKKDV